MRGWGEESKAAVGTEQRVRRGRGFQEQEQRKEEEEEAVSLHACVLTGDYARYTIDPDDSWRPHHKAYAELQEGWEFSHAWSFVPEERPDRPPKKGPLRGVLRWRAEHHEAGNFAVAFGRSAAEARSWLVGAGRGEEPCVLDFKLLKEEERWEFRFARSSSLPSAAWKPLPWSDRCQSHFWVATFEQDGRRYLCAGLGEFPERKFFTARVRDEPKVIGFGAVALRRPFVVRGIAVFGRGSLRGAPFAGRDHFIEVSASREDAAKALVEHSEDVTGLLPVSEGACVVACASAARVPLIAAALSSAGLGATPVAGAEWSWPPRALEGNGPDCARQLSEAASASRQALSTDVLRELALFGEHVDRKTRHLEGTRLARSAAMRMILSGLGTTQ